MASPSSCRIRTVRHGRVELVHAEHRVCVQSQVDHGEDGVGSGFPQIRS
jgi:hypothetical protein